MTRRRLPRKKLPARRPGCAPIRLEDSRPNSYAGIVRHYKQSFQTNADREMRFFAKRRSLDEVLEYAAYAKLPSGKRHPHQYRLKHASLRMVHQRLRNCDLEACETFHELLEMIRDAIVDIPGIGELMVYDTAHRIGAFLKLKPERVYLHAGTRKGALALGQGRGSAWLDIGNLPKSFQHLTPAEVEDCLCIYKRDLQRIRGLEQD